MAQPLVLDPTRALIFRITHRANVPWIVQNGLQCAASQLRDPGFVPIGNADLINRRHLRAMPPPFGGTLSNYVPFYFTPYSPMLLNILTGYNGMRKFPKEEIVIFVTSINHLVRCDAGFIFSDRHAYLQTAQFSCNPVDLSDWLPWGILQARDFKRDPNDPAKVERYQAEALVHNQVPLACIQGLICSDDSVRAALAPIVSASNPTVQVLTRPGWYL